MANQIEDIVKNMSMMSDDEIRERIQELRRTRNVKPKVSNKSGDRPAKASKGKDTLVSLLAGMSEEERNNLIAKLQES